MEKFITDERTGLRYELVGDYYLIAGDDKPECKPIGVWGQRHLRYLKEHRRVLYANLLTAGKLNSYLADIDQQADEMFDRLTKQMATAEGIQYRTIYVPKKAHRLCNTYCASGSQFAA